MNEEEFRGKIVEVQLRDRPHDEGYVLEYVVIETVLGRYWLYGLEASTRNMVSPGTRTLLAISDISHIRIYDSVKQYDQRYRSAWKRLDRKCETCGSMPDHCPECGHCMAGYGD